jgi:predicted cytidylate kinase
MRNTFLNPFKGDDRPNELGYLFVIGGPGAVGTTTIAKALAEHFKLGFIYSGKIMRNIAKEKGYESLEIFLESDYFKKFGDDIDQDIDMRMIKASMQPDVIIDGKNFAALSTSQKIPCTVKIWLDASIETRVTRFLSSREGLSESDRFDISRETFEQTRKKLESRYEIDKERFERLYGIDYDKPELYNDIVLDTSGIDEAQTFNLILSRIENGGYLKEESDSAKEI